MSSVLNAGVAAAAFPHKATAKRPAHKAEKIISEIFDGKLEKRLSDFGIKPFFRLHPPRGGIKSKLHFPKGVLGDHGDKINLLIERML